MKNKPDDFLNPDLTPLIDIVFLLLIFFLVASVFKKQELALLLNLPTSESGEISRDNPKDWVIEMKQEELALNGKKIDIKQLEAKLSSCDKKQLIKLKADDKVYYKQLIEILDLLNKHEMSNLSLMTIRSKH